MEMMTRIIEESKRRREADAQRFKDADMDLCMCCHAYGEDKRSLWVDCLYAVHEVVPEAIDLGGVEPSPKNHNHGYYLRICKSCRGRFLTMMGEWWKAGVDRRDIPKDHDGHNEFEPDPERNIPVRVNGAIVLMTRAEWAERQND
jgi:hypothetical protein